MTACSGLLKAMALVALLALPFSALAQYRCVDDKGKVSYSDKPRSDCKGGQTGVVTKGGTSAAPQGQSGPKGPQKGLLDGFKSEQPAKPAAPTPAVAAKEPAKVPPETREQFVGRCEAIKQERAFLAGPRGEGIANKEARIAALDKAAKDCP
jgi:hypothetical protein